MFIYLCRNCFNLLNVALRYSNAANRYYPSLLAYHSYNANVQGSVLLAGENDGFLQRPRFFVTQTASEPFIENRERTKKKKKSDASSVNASSTESNDWLPDLTSYPEVETFIETEIDQSPEYNLEETCQQENVPQPKKPKKKSKKTLEKEKLKLKEQERIMEEAKKMSLMLSLRSYIDVCLYLNQHDVAHRKALLYLRRGKLRVRSPEIDVSVFNLLLRYSAKKGDLSYVKSLVELLRNENVTLDHLSYLSMFVAIGCSKIADQAKCRHEMKEVIQAMEAQNFSPEAILIETAPSKEEKEIVAKLFEENLPDVKLKTFSYPQDYKCRLLQELNLKQQADHSPLASGSVTLLEDLKQSMSLQFSREAELTCTVKSIQKDSPTKRVQFFREKISACEAEWRTTITRAFKFQLKLQKNIARYQKTMNIFPYLNLLPVDTYVDLIMNEIRFLCQSSDCYGLSLTDLRRFLGLKVRMQYMVAAKHQKGHDEIMKSLYGKFLQYFLDKEVKFSFNVREYWQHLLLCENLENFQMQVTEPWPSRVLCDVGQFMYDILMTEVKINPYMLDPNSKKSACVPAFYTVHRNLKNRVQLEICPHRLVNRLYRESDLQDLQFGVIAMPMLCPPLPWTTVDSGGFLLRPTHFMRISEHSVQKTILKHGTSTQQLYPIFDSLNNLSMCPWIINKPMLDLLIDVFNRGDLEKLGIPSHPSRMPPPPQYNENLTPKEKFNIMKERSKHRQKKNEMYSLWCDTLYKISIANHFRDTVFWFPHNMDFRGRAYATAPHFSHIGNDLSRSIMLFANGRPLGKHGLDWLKIHVINLTGLKKRETNSQRLQYANSIMPDILDSADHPLTGKCWWQESDEPWQTLACCKELANAIRSGNPENYVTHYPVHQDGSCNGLQHYAALGRDFKGGCQVNLAPSDKPQDVYSGVAALVEEERARDARNGVEIAKILEGHVNRKTVKQTVMTIVYGVTRYGARLQILKRLKESSFPPEHEWRASQYLVQKTFLSIGEIFSNTSTIQNWFTECASLISRVQAKSVQWVTPLGLPVVQPYIRKTAGEIPDTRFYVGLPDIIKQRNAFPPNFIHSLDSSHMMLTSLFCNRAGIEFASVHDCYWTHPSSVNDMNKICREQFVALHNEPILEDLSDFLFGMFSVPESEIKNNNTKVDNAKKQLNQTLKAVPKKGDFILEEVLKSTYFFS